MALTPIEVAGPPNQQLVLQIRPLTGTQVLAEVPLTEAPPGSGIYRGFVSASVEGPVHGSLVLGDGTLLGTVFADMRDTTALIAFGQYVTK